MIMTRDSIFSQSFHGKFPLSSESQPLEAPPISVVEVEVSSPATSGVKVGWDGNRFFRKPLHHPDNANS